MIFLTPNPIYLGTCSDFTLENCCGSCMNDLDFEVPIGEDYRSLDGEEYYIDTCCIHHGLLSGLSEEEFRKIVESK